MRWSTVCVPVRLSCLFLSLIPAQVERFAFYERAKKAYAVVATGETAPYANLILKKGIIASVTTN